MDTLLTRSPGEAAALLRDGGRVAFPTETVYGLGADAFDAEAVRGIFEAKGRPSDNPLIVHVAAREQVDDLAEEVPAAAARLMERFFPGPLTLVLPRRPSVPSVVTAGLATVGVRMPRHATAGAFLRACRRPVAAPSANRSGRPSPTTWQAVRDDLGGRIEAILQGRPTDAGLESTVVDCSDAAPGGPLVVLRTGALAFETLQEALPDLNVVLSASLSEKNLSDERGTETGASEHRRAPRSPGQRHRHYAPDARVRLIDHPGAVPAAAAQRSAYIGLDAPAQPFALARACDDLDAYAHELFAFFRRADAEGCRTIYAQRVPEAGLGRALMDRVRRASMAR